MYDRPQLSWGVRPLPSHAIDMTHARRLLLADVLIGTGVLIPLSAAAVSLEGGAGSCSFWRAGTAVFALALMFTGTGVALSGQVALVSERTHDRVSAGLGALGLLFLLVNAWGLWYFGRTLAAFWHPCVS